MFTLHDKTVPIIENARAGVCHLEVPTGLEHMAEIAALIEADLISAERSQTRGNS